MTQRAAPNGVPSPARRHVPVFLAGLGALALCAALSLALGARSVPLSTVADALFGHAHGREALVVTGLRLPRTVIGLAVGAALGVAGRRRPGHHPQPARVADHSRHQRGRRFRGGRRDLRAEAQRALPSMCGSRSPAPRAPPCSPRRWPAAPGTSIPVRLALGGTVLQLVLLSWTSAVMLMNQRTLDEARFWLAGSLSGRPLDVLWPVLPTAAARAGGRAGRLPRPQRPCPGRRFGPGARCAGGPDPTRRRHRGRPARRFGGRGGRAGRLHRSRRAPSRTPAARRRPPAAGARLPDRRTAAAARRPMSSAGS